MNSFDKLFLLCYYWGVGVMIIMRYLTKKEKKTYEEKLIKLIKIGEWDDTHSEILNKIGYRKIVSLFKDLDKWYS